MTFRAALAALRLVSCSQDAQYFASRVPSRAFGQSLRRPPHASATHSATQLEWTRRKDVRSVPDTIYALSTAPGRAAIAIIRISGPACLDIYGGLCPTRPFPIPRIATLRKLYDPRANSPLESNTLDPGALTLYFPAPNTVTGEDLLELHVHGGPAIVRSILEAIPACTNSRERRRTAEYSLIRPAEAGEFTKRAFYNGRLDLTQAEALGDTLAAETEQQRRLAIGGSENGLAKRYEEWRQMLLYARGELEALIDFSEDQHFDESPQQFVSSITQQVEALKRQIEVHIKNATRGELLRSGISIALLGAPNAGKSSLLNRIVGRKAAIVSAEAGTTRDIVDVSVDIGGWLCRLGDMAGVRVNGQAEEKTAKSPLIGAIEEEGIRRARARALESDVVIVLLPVVVNDHKNGLPEVSIEDEVVEAVQECESAGKEIVFVINKIDLVEEHQQLPPGTEILSRFRNKSRSARTDRIFTISCNDNASSGSDPGNIQHFLNGLASIFYEMTTALAEAGSSSTTMLSPSEAQSYWSASLSISHRQSNYLRECLVHLDNFLLQTGRQPVPSSMSPSTHHIDYHDDLVGEVDRQADSNFDFDIVSLAEDLRFAADNLAKITGRGEGGDVEDVLGVVFEK